MKNEKMKLEKIVKITGKIELKTGLHIGAGNDSIHIGGVDNAVIKDPITKKPYIPGSSIKGKIRTLLEWATGRAGDSNPFATTKDDDPIARIFGNGSNSGKYKVYKGGPTRASFSDCQLSEENNKKLEEIGYTEIKTEVRINRISGTAADGGLRSTERVPAGAKFDFEVTYKVFDEQDEENLELLLLGMKLLEYDALGGSTSRGYGRISFKDVTIEGSNKRFDDIKINNDSFKNWEFKGER
ncbi:MAG: type III-A CRISPR-associated RAMP protein Csm3 [Desulfurella sp.]|uniref:type III-A CRISPR-associated RAMP protein Csm3 n=2 Tax=Desulfurella sp. TaxID=1962857 RepID=UPI003D0D02FB